MDVQMPDGTVIQGIPDGTSKDAIMDRYTSWRTKVDTPSGMDAPLPTTALTQPTPPPASVMDAAPAAPTAPPSVATVPPAVKTPPIPAGTPTGSPTADLVSGITPPPPVDLSNADALAASLSQPKTTDGYPSLQPNLQTPDVPDLPIPAHPGPTVAALARLKQQQLQSAQQSARAAQFPTDAAARVAAIANAKKADDLAAITRSGPSDDNPYINALLSTNPIIGTGVSLGMMSPADTIDALHSGLLRVGAGLGSSLTAIANNFVTRDPNVQGALVNNPVVASTMKLADLLLDKDQNGYYKQPDWTQVMRGYADEIQPALMNVSFSDAKKAGQGMNWVLTQTAAGLPQMGLVMAGIVQPELMPAVLATMGASGAGEQYDADIKRGVDPHRAALDAAINGSVQVGAGGLSMVVAKIATPMTMAFLRGLDAAAAETLSQKLLKMGVAEFASATVGIGSDIAGQVAAKGLTNLSQQYVAGIPTDTTEGMQDTAMAFILQAPLFYASGRIPHIASNVRDTLAETVVDRALARAAQPDQSIQDRVNILRGAVDSAAKISPTFTQRKLVQLVQAGHAAQETEREPDAANLPDQTVLPPPAEEGAAGPTTPGKAIEEPNEQELLARALQATGAGEPPVAVGLPEGGGERPAGPGVPGIATPESPEAGALRDSFNARDGSDGITSGLRAGDIKIVPETAETLPLRDALESVTGGDTVKFVSDPDGKLPFNGVVSSVSGKRTLYINVDGDSPTAFTGMHEAVHVLAQQHPDLYAALRDVLREEGIDLAGARKFHFGDDSAHISDASVEEEAIADYAGNHVMDRGFLNKIEQRDPTLFATLLGYARDFLAKFSDKLGPPTVANSRWVNDNARTRQALENFLHESALRNNPKYAAAKALERTVPAPTGAEEIAAKARRTEARPSEGVPLPTDHAAQAMRQSPTSKVTVARAVQREVPLSHLTEALGIPHYAVRYTFGSGAYEGGRSPNLVAELSPSIPVKTVRQLAHNWMYVYHQDSVPFFRAGANLDPAKSQLGVRVVFDKPLTDTREREMAQTLRDAYGADASYAKIGPKEIAIVNYGGENNQAFMDKHQAFLDAMATQNKPVLSEHFNAESEQPSHDWNQDPTGRQLVGADRGSAALQSDLQARLDSWRQRVQQAGDAFANRQADQQGGAGDRAVSGDAGTPAAQATAAVENAKASIKREVATPEFKRWFRQSDIKNEDGTPKMMYHGTARDIREFRGKQAGAIFVTSDPEFADAFTSMSKDWMYKNADQILTKEQLDAAEKAAEERLAANKPADDEWTPDEAWRIVNEEREKYFPSNENIMPVFVRAEKPFDYENKAQIDAITKAVFDDPALQHRVDAGEDKVYLGGPASNDPSGMRHLSPYSKADFKHLLSEGYWDVIEHSVVQRALKAQGYDGFYVREAGRKNLAVYDPNQLKSAVGNSGEYSRESNDITLRRKNQPKALDTETPEFKNWFGDSEVKTRGKPTFMYHATAHDISTFDPQRGDEPERSGVKAIFLSPNPAFAHTFAGQSQREMENNPAKYLTPEQRITAQQATDERLAKARPGDDDHENEWSVLREEQRKLLPSSQNIMPLYVRAERPFDYQRPTQRKAVVDAVFNDRALEREDWGEQGEAVNVSDHPGDPDAAIWYTKPQLDQDLRMGMWTSLEQDAIQRAIKAVGHDGFYIHEGGEKNLAVYDPNQVKSAIGNSGEYSRDVDDITLRKKTKTQSPMFTTTDKDRFATKDQTKAQEKIQKFVDRFERVLRIQKMIKDQGGNVNDLNNIYYALERMPGRTDARVAEFVDVTLEPLIHAAAKAKVDLNDAMMLAYALHAPERNEQIAKINPEMQDGGSGMSTARAHELVAEFQARPDYDKIKEIANRFQAITTETANILKREGLITPEAAANWEKTYQRYVPLRGGDETRSDRDIYGNGKLFDERGEIGQRALGRATEAEPSQIFGNIVQDRIAAVVRSEKNKIGKTLLQFVLDNPDKNLWSVDEIKKTRSLVTNAAGQQEVVEHANFNRDPENTIVTKIGGHEFAITIHDPVLAAQLTGMSRENLDALTKSLGTINRAFVKLWTQWNPVFIGTNFFRDTQTGLTHSLVQYGMPRMLTSLKYVAPALNAGWQYARGKRTGSAMLGYYHDFVMNGGRVGRTSVLGLDERIREINRLYANADMPVWKYPLRATQLFLEVISDMNHTAENAIRVAAYRAAIEAGESAVEATHQARTIRVDFNKRGDYTGMANSLWLFFNPAMQETARIASVMKNHPKAMGAIVASQIAMGFTSAFLSAQDKDEDGIAYWDKPEYQQRKQRNLVFIIPGTGGKAVMIPLPYGYNAFPNMGYAAFDLMHGTKSKTQIAKDVASAMWEGFSPVGGAAGSAGPSAFVPTVWQSALFALSNRDDFGSKIVPGEDTRPSSQRYKVGTRGTPQQLATEWLNSHTGGDAYIPGGIDISPEAVDFMTKFATGGLGTFLYDGMSIAFQALMGGANAADLQRLPFVRQFAVLGHDNKRDAGLYYDRMSQLKQAVADYHDAVSKQDEDRKLALEDRFGTDMLTNVGDAMHQYQSMLKDLRDQELAIHDSDDPYGSKQVQLREIDAKRGEVYLEFNKLFTAANQGKLSLDLPGK